MDGSHIQPFPTKCNPEAVTQKETQPAAKNKKEDAPTTPTDDDMKYKPKDGCENQTDKISG